MPSRRGRIRSSYSEIERIARESIRGLGFHYGMAEDLAKMLIWTEALTGRGIECLRDAYSDGVLDLSHSLKHEGSTFALDGELIFGSGLQVFEYGQMLAQRDPGEVHRLRIESTRGWIFFRYLVAKARSQGVYVGVANLSLEGAEKIERALNDRSIIMSKESSRAILDGGTTLRNLADNEAFSCDLYFVKSYEDEPPIVDSNEFRTLRALHEALRGEDLHVHQVDFDFLGEQQSNLRAPSSERSRKQAG